MFAEYFFSWMKQGKKMDETQKRVMLACLACHRPGYNERTEVKRRLILAWLNNR